MGVTAFRQINNNSTSTITLVNHENSSNTVNGVEPHTTVGIEVWIPWCVSTNDFKWGHYLSVATPRNDLGYNQLWAIWQKDNQVCCCQGPNFAFSSPGTPIPGICAINGDRLLTINADLSITVSVIR
jgi:hypothetical protein